MPHKHFNYVDFTILKFVDYVLYCAQHNLIRVGRAPDGHVDYVCIWNLDDPECPHFEFVAGRGAQWVADRAEMLRGYTHFTLIKRGIKRKHRA